MLKPLPQFYNFDVVFGQIVQNDQIWQKIIAIKLAGKKKNNIDKLERFRFSSDSKTSNLSVF